MPYALECDTYLLTVAQGLFDQGRHRQEGVSYAFTRRAPFNGSSTTIIGLHTLIKRLKDWAFSQADIDYLATLCYPHGQPRFSKAFLQMLSGLHFDGELYAVPEGSVLLPNEPILTLQAPMILCQLLETLIINAFAFPSLVASKTVRVLDAAQADPVVEFGMRRAQGMEAALLASRAAYIAGVKATSNTLAGQQEGIPVTGTVSHSWVLSFDDESEAFDATAQLMGESTVLLVDTYQTAQGVRHAIRTAQRMQSQGITLKAIRLDSGDLLRLSQEARSALDEAGLQKVAIMASGDLDEDRIQALKAAHAPIDQWGVGTRLVTAFDQPALDIAYKLAAVQTTDGWAYKQKRSDTLAKATLPGKPRIWRHHPLGKAHCDTLYDALSDNPHTLPPGEPLLQPIYSNNQWQYTLPDLDACRAHAQQQRKLMRNTVDYKVQLSPNLAKAAGRDHP